MLISIVIATYNRSQDLKNVLQSLLDQNNDGTFQYEVIVVDNNSTDKTKAVVEAYIPHFDVTLKYLFEPEQGKAYALNRGGREAKGEIIVFTDDDVLIDSDWILNIGKFFNEYPGDLMGGRVLPVYPADTPQWIKDNQDLLTGPIVSHDYGEEVKQYDTSMLPAVGANLAVKRELFEQYGFFRTDLGPGKQTFGDDTEYFRRLEKIGKKLYYCGKVLVKHPASKERMTWKYFKSFNIASGRYHAIRKMEKPDDNEIYYFGVPRYRLKSVVWNLLRLMFSIFNRRSFLRYYSYFFKDIGMIEVYRAYKKERIRS